MSIKINSQWKEISLMKVNGKRLMEHKRWGIKHFRKLLCLFWDGKFPFLLVQKNNLIYHVWVTKRKKNYKISLNFHVQRQKAGFLFKDIISPLHIRKTRLSLSENCGWGYFVAMKVEYVNFLWIQMRSSSSHYSSLQKLIIITILICFKKLKS